MPDTRLRNAKPQDKRYRITIGESVFLEVMTTGKKVWRMRYRRPDDRKQAFFTIGDYPEISQPEARQAAYAAKQLINRGLDPNEEREREQQEQAAAIRRQAQLLESTFEKVARDWHHHRLVNLQKWTPRHADKIMQMLEADIFPEIGAVPIAELTAPQLLAVIQKVVDRGAVESARKLNRWISAVYRYAVVRKLVQHNEADNLRDELPTPERKNNPHLVASDVHDFILDVEQDRNMGEVVRIAILFTLHTLARTGETRHARWDEFDLEAREWRIPAERMKMKRPHTVPLSAQVLALTGSAPGVYRAI
ncbi:MAG: integrase arm-type DNA-binding domain-containing protein [Thiolinea sp.]